MIKVEGYKAFAGTMLITPKNGCGPHKIVGEWLYKPDMQCWYCNGWSFPADVCEVIENETKGRD